MKFQSNIICLISILAISHSYGAATITVNAGQLRDASGTVVADGSGVWAIIVAGAPGNPPTAGALPGGLTLGTSLTGTTSLQIQDIADDFNNVQLTVGNKEGYHIAHLQAFDSGASALETPGFAFGGFTLPVNSSGDAGFTSGATWGLYWFPGKSIGATLTGSYQVGGFANTLNTASGFDTVTNTATSDSGTVVPAAGGTVTANFFETTFNVGTLLGPATGLTAARFTAVAVPEPTTLTLSALAALGLLRRRRA